MDYYETLPHFFGYFGISVFLAAVFLVVYTFVTPHKELELIRDGNTSVSIQLTGSFLGFALALAAVISHSVNMLDVLLWGFIALVVQIVTFVVIAMVFSGISYKLRDKCVGSGVFVGGISFGIGILQAACMVP